MLDDLYPIVSTKQNFDQVLVPEDHVSRSPNDTYYVDPHTVLRCHTSAHQVEILQTGRKAFLVTGDVYRRDSIDATHYPVFHQMEARTCVTSTRDLAMLPCRVCCAGNARRERRGMLALRHGR